MTAPPVSPLQYGYPLRCPICGNDGPSFTRLYQLDNHMTTVHPAPAPADVAPPREAPPTDADVQHVVGALARARYEAFNAPDLMARVSGLVLADALEMIVKLHDQLGMTALPLSRR